MEEHMMSHNQQKNVLQINIMYVRIQIKKWTSMPQILGDNFPNLYFDMHFNQIGRWVVHKSFIAWEVYLFIYRLPIYFEIIIQCILFWNYIQMKSRKINKNSIDNI